jgi:hypothetical protein
MSDISLPETKLDDLPAISLDELQGDAAFLTRRDRKYLLPLAGVESLLALVDPATRVLEIEGRRCFGYLTPYFDDEGFSAYLSAARRRPNRFKVRTRLYTDSGLHMLELKVRDARGRTVKHRLDRAGEALEQLADGERSWLHTFPQVAPYADDLCHCLTTRYRRATLALPNAAGRLTIDTDLRVALPDGTSMALSPWAIVETKGAGTATTVDRLLWRLGYRPLSMSKFTVGLSLLIPDLPANHWHRARTRLRSGCMSEDSGDNADWRMRAGHACHWINVDRRMPNQVPTGAPSTLTGFQNPL